MRYVPEVAAIVGIGLIGLGVARVRSLASEEEEKASRTSAAVERITREISVRSATKSVELNERGFPRTIDPAWFEHESEPVNTLLDDRHPWLEIAGPEQGELLHPPIRIVLSESTPGLWYNPYKGVVRARVSTGVSDEQSLKLYNRVNRTALPSLFWHEPMPTPPAPAPAPTEHAEAPKTTENTKPAHREPMVVNVRRTKPSSGRGR